MLAILLIFLGGGAGAAGRYLILQWSSRLAPGLPWGTFVVNILGSFVLGFLAIFYRQHILAAGSNLAARELWRRVYVPLYFAGFCGGFTTFSSYVLDVYNQFLAGNFMKAWLVLFAHVIFGLLAAGLGIYLAWRLAEGLSA